MMRKSLCTGLAAHGQHLAVLQGPQQLHLERQGYIGHLVQEDRAAVGLLQDSPPGLLGAGEGPAGMAEQLAFGQGRAERGHVHGHERSLPAAAVVVDRPGDKFLARAAFAPQVDAGVGRGHQGDPPEDLLHRRRAADDLLLPVAGGKRQGRRRLGRGGHRPLDGAWATARSKGLVR